LDHLSHVRRVPDEHERVPPGVLAQELLQRLVVETGGEQFVCAHAVGEAEGFRDEFGSLARADERAVQDQIGLEAEAGERRALCANDPLTFRGERALGVNAGPCASRPVGEAVTDEVKVQISNPKAQTPKRVRA
ncbi:MAG: hypothetical protein HW418_2290, partial [Anaerolineales bacterium]|nr:hypothetical protein [Anaerolineales bacterium]